MNLYINYSETSTGGEPCPGQEGSYFKDHEPIYYNITYHYATFEKPKNTYGFKLEILKDIEKFSNLSEVFLAVVIYSSSSTFGRSEGHHAICAVTTTYREALNVLEDVENREGYNPWDGYFESLTSKKVFPVRLI